MSAQITRLQIRLPWLSVFIALLLLWQQRTVGDDVDAQELIAKVKSSVVTIRVQGRDGTEVGIGTGFVISDDGLIATNFHVITEGRPFRIETANGKSLKVLAVEASDVKNDLAVVRIDNDAAGLVPLKLAKEIEADQGLRVLAFGHPHGLQDSVVEGIVSAKREVEGQDLLQLAMPIDPGNSGGPLVDMQGRVHGIVNMKSAIDENLGFAIPVQRLTDLMDKPNPIQIERWVKLSKINEKLWTPMMGADWRERGGRILVNSYGDGFGGRSLLLSKSEVPSLPFEIAVKVRLDDSSGAAGLVFHSDGADKHYGFYPSGGRLRLSCFKGPSVFSWQVLQEVESEHYLPEQWNQLKVRIEEGRILCFVNGQKVIESKDQQLAAGKVGLAKFRGTQPEFTSFQLGDNLPSPTLSKEAKAALSQLEIPKLEFESKGSEQIDALGRSGALSSRELIRRAKSLEKQAEQLRQLAADAMRATTLDALESLDELPQDLQLLHGALLIAQLDNPDLDIDSYLQRIESMADALGKKLKKDASPVTRRAALHEYLFEENGFHGSRSEYYHSANSHLNRVIDDREGLPITLSILYIELARRIGMKVEGIGIPGRFVVAQYSGRAYSEDENPQFIDVFERGILLSNLDLNLRMTMNSGTQNENKTLEAQNVKQILTRVLNNLIEIAGRKNDGESMLRYCDAAVVLNPDMHPMRLMRAQIRAMTGRMTLALRDCEELLTKDLSYSDREFMERLHKAVISRLEQVK
ncbi:MAG: transglutaminase family protein [Planctomycetota bacterium]